MAEDKRERNSSRNLEEEKEDIDAKLEERAAQNNMTVANVKSLLHHVLKDKRVVAMAKKLANEDSSSEDIDLDIPSYEPRLTRARVREAVISSVTDVNFSPDKLSSLSVSTPLLPSISISSVAAPNALDELFPDVSSTEDEDDDYLPDTDTTVNNEDILVESDTETGDPIDTEIEEEEEGEEEEGGERIQETQVTSSRGVLTDTDEAVQAATLLASLSDVNFTPLKDQAPLLPPIYPPVSTQPIQAYQPGPPELSNDEIIAKRTRSKRPLVDTDINEIEASFNPPDVPSDDESQTVQDIDEDELEWQKWLADLMNPRSADMSGLDDQEDDTEYNFWAEKHDDLEKEEFRTDRGVKIPQKEVDELIEELLNPNIGVLNADPNPIVSSLNYLDNTRTSTTTNNSGVDLTSAYLLESLGLRPPMLSQSALQATPLKDSANTETRREEEQEMQTEPTTSSLEGNKEQGLSRDQMVQVWDQLQQHFQLLMQTFIMSRFEPSLVFIAQLAAQAVKEVGVWCKEASEGNNSPMWYIPGIDEALQLINQYNPHNNNDIELISAFGNPPRVPDVVQDVIMTHGIFWQYPYHLPEHGLSPVESSGTQGSKYFTTTEDYLLVLGMDHYGSSSWKLIQEKLLPTKTTKQLHLRVKNLTSKRTKQDNVIKYYKRTGEIKIPFDKDAIDPYLFTRLPQWIIKYHLKREQVEYEEREKKEKRKEELKKIATTYNLLSSSSSSSSCPPSSSSSSSSPGGSKRNLKDDLESVAPSKTLKKGKKRMRLSLGPIETQSETKTGCKGDYRQLLYMAGLEGSDPAARYAFNYLTEVKAMTMSSPENYNTFLKLLITARKREWSPGKLYMAVKPVLQQWPYLLKLFMAFLDPKDAVQAKVIADKIDFEQVKTFSRNLQDQYGDSPLQLSDILSKLRSLEAADDTRKNQIVLELNEMMLSHDELLSDLRHFVSGVLPAKRITEKSQNDFEEVNISSSDQKQAGDDFEEVSVPHDWEGYSSQHITSSP